MITLTSTTSSRRLCIRRESPDALHVQLIDESITAASDIWLDEEDAPSLCDFFTDLGKQQRPWPNERCWQSTEGDFTLTVRCSALGAVQFQVVLKGLQGAPEEWQVTAGIESELGQLARIADEAAQMKTGG